MNNLIQTRTMLMVMLLGLLFTAAVSTANAQDRCRTRGRYTTTSGNYYNDNSYDRTYQRDNSYDRTYQRDSRSYYYDDEDTTGKAVRRTAIGAGIGTLGGAVVGGKKGALIGAGIGAAGGYIYHREKVNRQRNRGWW